MDLGDRALLRARTWRWLRIRIIGLLQDPETRLYRALNPEKFQPPLGRPDAT